MRRTLLAVGVTAIASGILLLVATLALDAWRWHLHDQSQAQLNSGPGWSTVPADKPPRPPHAPVIAYVQLFVASCAVATVWAVFIVLPSVLASRRVFTSTLFSHLLAAAVVCTISAIAFAYTQHPNAFISPMITFLVGGTIGLVSVVLMVKSLPPNTSLERTRGR